MDRQVDLLIRHGYVITMDDERRIIVDGAVAIAGRRIVALGSDTELASLYTATRTIDAGGAPVHPGLIESHMHASYQTMRGFIADHVVEDQLFEEGSIDRAFYNTVTEKLYCYDGANYVQSKRPAFCKSLERGAGEL